MRLNPILQTDSYKLTHWAMYPLGTTHVSSYLEARPGGQFDRTTWFGLQYFLKEYLEDARITRGDVDDAHDVAKMHFGHDLFNRTGWLRVVEHHGGRIPVRIRALREGISVGAGNALMTVENTDPALPWITNAVESLLLKVWYPTTVATLSAHLRARLENAVLATGGEHGGSEYMLHDFGYRGVSSEESAMLGGAAHLLNFTGTDTLVGMEMLRHYYGASLEGLAHSVAASEHSIMTADGPIGELALARKIIATHPNQIVSIVADSYDYYRFVDHMADQEGLVNSQRARLVIRPDSVTPTHPTPESLVLWTLNRLAERLGTTSTPTGHRVIPYGILWGDGLSPDAIERVLKAVVKAGFAAQNMVFGMGGGLLQKVNRDTCRFAFKCSAQKRDGVWRDVQKKPLDASKASKAGRLSVRFEAGEYETVPLGGGWEDCLDLVFENGVILRQQTFEDVRRNARSALSGSMPKLDAVAAAS